MAGGDKGEPEKAAEPRLGGGWRAKVAQLFAPPSAGAGSGLMPRPVIRWLVWARRLCQTGCFALFCYLLFQTTFRGSFAAADEPVRVGLPVEGFLLADPFVALLTLLSTHTIYRGLLWSVGIVALTLLFGRVFCGWICPFGALHHFFSWIFPSRYLKGGKRVKQNRTHPVRQRVKHYLLFGSLGAALFGSAVGGLLDPICLAVRSIGLAVLPAAQYATQSGGTTLADTNLRPLQSASDSVLDWLAQTVWQSRQLYFHEGWLIGFVLLSLLVVNRFIPRFWCRVLCPLGALLGVLSRFSLFGLQKDHDKCTDCNLCLRHCQGADSPQGGVEWRQDECHMCLNCEHHCPEDVIKLRFLPSLQSTVQKPDTVRRTAVASAAAGVVLLPISRAADGLDVGYSEKVIRPPGSVEEKEFLERCIRCGECMKVCPNNALHPALLEAGIEGLWTPILIPRIGYCEHSCVLCGEVCPTGAIRKISEKHKLGLGCPPITIGTAFYDHGRCLPWAMATPCIVCEEFCPTSPKAIWVEEVEVKKREVVATPDGAEPKLTTVRVQRPYVDPNLCIGCGACENVCPVQDRPAIYVTSIGETRSKENVILLEDSGYSDK